MGETTGVNSTEAPARAASSPLRNLRKGMDPMMLIAIFALLAFGLLMVYSSSWQYSMVIMGQPSDYLFKRQLAWAGIGIVAAFIFSRINYRFYNKVAVPMILFAIAMLLVLRFVGELRLNATRALFNGSIQPSEFAKLAILIYLAVWLNSKKDKLNKFTFGLLPLIGILGITAGLIMAQPDLSAAATIIMIGGLMFFLSDGELKQIILVLVITILVGAVIVGVFPTGRERVSSYIAGFSDPTQAHDHIKRCIEAIVRGGFFGVGIGNSTTKYTGLPVAPTDSIFAVIVEETGLFGAATLIGLYVLFLWRGLKIAQEAPDMLGRLLAGGITFWIFLEAIINIGVMVNLLPFAGNALPLISSGGSNLVTTLSGIGIVLGVSRSVKKTPENEEGRSFGAVVDMRRRDGRRSVSRTVRSAGRRD